MYLNLKTYTKYKGSMIRFPDILLATFWLHQNHQKNQNEFKSSKIQGTKINIVISEILYNFWVFLSHNNALQLQSAL